MRSESSPCLFRRLAELHELVGACEPRAGRELRSQRGRSRTFCGRAQPVLQLVTRSAIGGNDIWVSQRPTVSSAWGAPVNLGRRSTRQRRSPFPRSQRTGTGCSSPAPAPAGSASPISTSPTAPISTTISAGRRPPTSAPPSTPRRTRTATGTSTTAARCNCSSAATGWARPGAPTSTLSTRQADGYLGSRQRSSPSSVARARTTDPTCDPTGWRSSSTRIAQEASAEATSGARREPRSTRPGRRRSTSARS